MKDTQSKQQAAFTTMAGDIKPLQLDQRFKQSLKQRVLARIKTPCPEGGITVHAAQVDWIKITDHLSVKVLSRDVEKKVQTSYWRLKPGAVIPRHSHQHDEDCLVLEGDIRIGGHVLFAGDFNTMVKGSSHGPITTVGGALLYLKHDMHDDFGWMSG